MRERFSKRNGFTLIELLIVITVMSVIVAIALMMAAVQPRRAANEASAIITVRTILTAERVYSETRGHGSFGSLDELHEANVIDEVIASGSKSGYTFALEASGESFSIVATPESEQSGTRSFFADQTGVIRFAVGSGGAGAGDEPIGG